MAREVVAPVHEVPIHLFWVFHRRPHRLRGVAIGAVALLMAHRTGRGRGRRNRWMGAGEIPLVAEEADRFEWEVDQIDMAPAALAVPKLLIVVVAAEARLHRGNWLLQLTARRESQVTDFTLLVLFQVLRVVDTKVRLVDNVGAWLVRPRVAHPALASVLLLLVARKALSLLGKDSRLSECGLVEDGFVTSETFHTRLGMACVVGVDLIGNGEPPEPCTAEHEQSHHRTPNAD